MMSTINRIVYSIIIVIGFAGIVYLYWNNANNCKKLKIENLDLLNQNSTLKHKYENSKEVIENSCNFDGLCLPNVELIDKNEEIKYLYHLNSETDPLIIVLKDNLCLECGEMIIDDISNKTDRKIIVVALFESKAIFDAYYNNWPNIQFYFTYNECFEKYFSSINYTFSFFLNDLNQIVKPFDHHEDTKDLSDIYMRTLSN